MILGLDVGGTHTDTVLIDGDRILAATKIPTGEDLLLTLRTALESILSGVEPGQIERMAFSTTLATNAIVEDRLERTGMIVSAGPGIDPACFAVGPSFHVVEGCLDHQGFEAVPLGRPSVTEAAEKIQAEGIRTIGITGKFSVRNAAHELQMADWVKGLFSHVAMGHSVSGGLNFPRRIFTTYLNASLHKLHTAFSNALIHTLDEKKLHGSRYLLKPDGGTIDLMRSAGSPVRTAQSGPAASVMGALALDGCHGATLVLDVGGTTTDMAVVLDGMPLLNPHGVKLGPYKTLIRSIITHSLGMGGDSAIQVKTNGKMTVGPLREGPPVAFGGAVTTPTDALVTLGLLAEGNKGAASAAMKDLGAALGCKTEAAAERVLQQMAETIAQSVGAFVHDINAQPVYTIHQVLNEEKIEPTSVLIMGGPAPHLAPYVEKALGLPCRVPPHYDVANAVGAAVARVTSQVTLQADTERGSVVIPEAGVEHKIDRSFDMDQAIAMARESLCRRAMMIGAQDNSLETSITEKQVFNMIRGYRTVGRNIRLKMSITPGLIPQWKRSF
ncbi:MAG: hydantoinase/oxoprolinase family protein [Deltaproteobacteria bacterium]|nr:hydantoinase/oxoprolinase family protein [Deltaproteobacteria bacterium]